jgi:hypothetical protein
VSQEYAPLYIGVQEDALSCLMEYNGIDCGEKREEGEEEEGMDEGGNTSAINLKYAMF